MCVMSLLNRCRHRPCYSRPVLWKVKPSGGLEVVCTGMTGRVSAWSRQLPSTAVGDAGQEQSCLEGLAEVRAEGRRCVCRASLRMQLQSRGMDGEYVSLPYSPWQLSSVSLAPAVAFGKCVGAGQERKVQFDLMAFH